jgi:hypothetical protein
MPSSKRVAVTTASLQACAKFHSAMPYPMSRPVNESEPRDPPPHRLDSDPECHLPQHAQWHVQIGVASVDVFHQVKVTIE